MRKPYKYTKELLQEHISKSNSYRQLILSFGLKYPSGGSQNRFKTLIKEYGININHFRGQGWNKGGIGRNKHTKESFTKKVLCVNGLGFSTWKIKQRLFEYGLKEKKCEHCNAIEWMNQDIPLELHHINGNKQDNRIENLQILCPNCHALTDNYRGKNKNI